MNIVTTSVPNKNKRNTENDEENDLIKKALLLSPLVYNATLKFQESFCKDGNYNKINEKIVLVEGIYFLLHLVDRSSFAILGPEKRDTFMKVVENEIFEKVIESNKLRRTLIETYCMRQKMYSNYVWGEKLKSESPVGTLLWEFGKIVAEMIEEPKSEKIMYAKIDMFYTLKYFYPDVKKLLNTGKISPAYLSKK